MGSTLLLCHAKCCVIQGIYLLHYSDASGYTLHRLFPVGIGTTVLPVHRMIVAGHEVTAIIPVVGHTGRIDKCIGHKLIYIEAVASHKSSPMAERTGEQLVDISLTLHKIVGYSL